MLYIMRHGKTDWNEARRLQGSSDIPLNEDGINMAKNARDEYKDVHFDVCFCSPLSRAYEITLLIVTNDNPIPTNTGNKNLIFFFKSLKKWLIALIKSSYIPSVNASVPPLTPGIILAIPIINTLIINIKLFIKSPI